MTSVATRPLRSWVKDRRATTADGAEIAYTVVGQQGPAVALCAGLLCPDVWWSELVPVLEDHGYRAVVWHYRGIGESSLPASAISMPRLAADLACIVEREGFDRLAIVGHSMGAQVMFETWRLMPGRISALAAVTGPYSSAIKSLYGRGAYAWAVYEPLRYLVRFVPPPLRAGLWRSGWRSLPAGAVGRLLRVFGTRTSDEVFSIFARHARTLEPNYVLSVLDAMHGHTAEDLLAQIDVPTLIVAGGMDPFVPNSVTRHMVDTIPAAVLQVVPDATHGALLEYPELVNGWLLDHLDRAHDRRG